LTNYCLPKKITLSIQPPASQSSIDYTIELRPVGGQRTYINEQQPQVEYARSQNPIIQGYSIEPKLIWLVEDQSGLTEAQAKILRRIFRTQEERYRPSFTGGESKSIVLTDEWEIYDEFGSTPTRQKTVLASVLEAGRVYYYAKFNVFASPGWKITPSGGRNGLPVFDLICTFTELDRLT